MKKEADLYAENALIPYEIYKKIITNNDISIKTINYFSNEIGVDSGIIVGRLQKDGYLKHNQMNEYKKKYSIE